MNRRIALIAVAVVLVGVAGIAAAGPVGTAVAQDGPVAANETSEGNGMGASNGTADISPGERLSGVIGVQRAEVAGRSTRGPSRSASIGPGPTRSERPSSPSASIGSKSGSARSSADSASFASAATPGSSLRANSPPAWRKREPEPRPSSARRTAAQLSPVTSPNRSGRRRASTASGWMRFASGQTE